MEQIKISQIVTDSRVYGRVIMSGKHIEALISDLRDGKTLPPIVIQRVKRKDGTVVDLLLDGKHRIEAFTELKRKEIPFTYWKDKVIDLEENILPLLGVSIRTNNKYGLKTSQADIRDKARAIAGDFPGITNKEIAREFDVSEGRISQCVADIRARQQASRDSKILKLSLLGWTQEEIGKVVRLDQSVIARIMQNFSVKDLHKTMNASLESGKSLKEIAEYHGFDLVTTLSLLLHEEDNDIGRVEKLNRYRPEDDAIKLKSYDIWNFSSCDLLFGTPDYVGRIPGQLVVNTLFYCSKPGDLVIDPMAGGGTTVDSCIVMGRKCLAYDLQPIENRLEIREFNLEDGFPTKKNASLIFLDPPYWSMKKKEYGEQSISFKPLEEYYSFMKKLIGNCYDNLKNGGHLALLIANQSGRKKEREAFGDKEYLDHVIVCYNYMVDVGFTIVRRVSVPLMPTSGPGQASFVTDAFEKKRMLGLVRELVIGRK